MGVLVALHARAHQETSRQAPGQVEERRERANRRQWALPTVAGRDLSPTAYHSAMNQSISVHPDSAGPQCCTQLFTLLCMWSSLRATGLFTEGAGLRAPSQAGFRPGLSTLHQIFTLQHLIDRAVHVKQPLFCCFLDLKGAYDRVPRALLWQSLARIGVPATLLAAIQSLYTTADYAISVGGRRGDCARSACGVKQGCPLSPTLFGILLDGLHWALLAGAPGAGPSLACGRRVPDLGYADDFCLLASSAADLQRLLDVAHGFLTSIGMALSLGKTGIMVFSSHLVGAPPEVAWTCGGLCLNACRPTNTWVLFSPLRLALLRPSHLCALACTSPGPSSNSTLVRCMAGCPWPSCAPSSSSAFLRPGPMLVNSGVSGV